VHLSTGVVQQAARAARAAASTSAVEVRPCADLDEVLACSDVMDQVWGRAADGARHAPVDFVRAIQHAGGWVAVAWDERGVAVGGSVGFLNDRVLVDGVPELHSHITGVLPSHQRGAVGFSLKLAQRAWCLERGILSVRWTFDPLVARNAWFNLAKLGATLASYHDDHYGPMDDAQNAGDPSDRAYAVWDLAAESVAAAADGHHAGLRAEDHPDAAPMLVAGVDGAPVIDAGAAGADLVTVAVPTDIHALRRDDPALALRWRLGVRATLGTALGSGARCVGIDRGGRYLLTMREGDR
jgi:predicted GNAT superfamily acetyltransferase